MRSTECDAVCRPGAVYFLGRWCVVHTDITIRLLSIQFVGSYDSMKLCVWMSK